MYSFLVTKDLAGKTIKEFFALQKFSALQVKRFKYYGEISVNGNAVAVQYVLQLGDVVRLSTNKRLQTPQFSSQKANVPYFDEYLYVAQKPYGVAIHPDRAHRTDTLGNNLATFFGNGFELRIVTRLDKTTDGLVLGALNEVTAQRLNEMQLRHEICKKYVAETEGVWEMDNGEICLPLLRDDQRNLTVVDEKGKNSQTRFEVLCRTQTRTTLLVEPLTGRTHQIRAHLAAMGHPIVGDVLYGAQPSQRIFLRCANLAFTHPETGEKVEVSCSQNFDETL
ncbi:MAG: RluA family pseudouridine synthase [Candidatus Fimimonas sp.]